MVIATSVLLGSCAQETKKTEEAGPLIGRAEVKVENGILTPEVLYSMARVSDAQLSPDGKKVAFTVRSGDRDVASGSLTPAMP